MQAGRSGDWIFTGLHWSRGRPFAEFHDRQNHDRQNLVLRPVAPSATVSWRILGPRRCIGVYRKGSRRPCPSKQVVDAASQCVACAQADPGRLLVQDLANPPGTFRTYLALFGAHVVKVGLTAERRASNRLLEQGALAHLFVFAGPYASMREVERIATAQLGIPQHLSWRRKRELWAEHPDRARRARQLQQVATRLRSAVEAESVPAPLLTVLSGEEVIHDFDSYGLDPAELARERRVVTLLQDGDVIAEKVSGVVGQMLVHSSESRPLVVDGRALQGWGLRRAQANEPTRLAVPPVIEAVGHQGSLFPL